MHYLNFILLFCSLTISATDTLDSKCIELQNEYMQQVSLASKKTIAHEIITLIKQKNSLQEMRDNDGNTWYHYAAYACDAHFINQLYLHTMLNAEQENHYGLTPRKIIRARAVKLCSTISHSIDITDELNNIKDCIKELQKAREKINNMSITNNSSIHQKNDRILKTLLSKIKHVFSLKIQE